jgi:hypothetical protein
MNEADFQPDASLETIAVDLVEPDCVPTFERSCPYTFLTLKVSFSDFGFDGIEWRDGTITITGPQPALDEASGIVISTFASVGFELVQGGKKKRVLAVGPANVRVVPDAHALVMSVKDLDFGGYRMSSFFLHTTVAEF